MKTPVSVLTVLLIALGAATAGAQTASPRVLRPGTATTAVRATPYAAVGKQTIPANLFGVEDRAIIIVGGKQVAAGDVKRQLLSELRQLSVPASASRRRAPVIPQSVPVRDLPGRFGPTRQASDRITATGGISSAAAGARGTTAYVNKPVLSYTELMNYCKTHPAEIERVRGTVTPNGRFTIEGICFGDQTGAVEAIGQFPGGNMRLVFDRWTDSQITAFVPPVSGAPDHSIALTVVRLDKSRSPAVQARFVATRQVVPVPAHFWSPTPDFVQIEVDQGGGDIFSGFKVWGAGHESRSTPFSLLINPACYLDGAGWATHTGRVEAFNGWENGPPHQANVEVVWTPRCTTQTTNYIVATSSQRICSIDFSLSASASCPVGMAP